MIVKLHLGVEDIETDVDTTPSASVVEKQMAHKLGMLKRVRKVKVRQGDGSLLEQNFVLNTTFR